jgi:hypothetical protein
MDIENLIENHPYLYHMAEMGSWPSIRTHGLWSTSALLDHHRITGNARFAQESQHRPNKTTLISPHFATTVLRDQKPMSDSRLQIALRDGLTPQNWYELLNSKTFFWVSRERLLTLLNARAYRNEEHDVITLRTEPLVRAYRDRILLCHMNSGNTFPMPHARGKETFVPIENYPVGSNGRPRKPVVELVVEYGVPDLAQYVISVERMRGGNVLSRLV